MRVQFVKRERGPERLVCEAEIVFDEVGPLAGHEARRASRCGAGPTARSTSPSPRGPSARAASGASSTSCASAEGTAADAKRVKAWILDAYRGSREESPERTQSPERAAFESGARGISKAPMSAVQEGLG